MFVYHRKAMYHETDQMGIIHHSNYIKWMEEGRISFIDSLGYTYRQMEETGVISPVTGVSVDYKRQVQFDDDIEIRISVQKYTGVVLEIAYEFFNVTKNEVCTTASSRHCFLKDGKIVSLKRALPQVHECFGAAVKGE